MYESVFQVDVLRNKKEKDLLKMLIMRSQKRIKISDYGVFQLSMHDFKEVSVMRLT